MPAVFQLRENDCIKIFSFVINGAKAKCLKGANLI